MQRIFDNLSPYFVNTYSFLAGTIAAICGYFLPIKDILQLMVLLFIMDVLFGAWRSKKIDKKRFSTKIIWETTMPRMLISVVLVIFAYMWDTTYSMEFVQIYKIVGWFISGVVLYSIAENGYKITKWGVFMQIGKLLKKKIEGETGEKVDKDDLLNEMKKEDETNQ